jgi:serine/threonine protein kinase
MDSPFPPALHPGMLAPGAVVGNWRVEDWAGRGVHGAVYRAVPLHDEHALSVALKLALHPADPRFAREVELLSRCEHPSIPRLVDHGSWQSASGTHHPFLAMQWVDGVPLYHQARMHPPSHAQVRRWMAQLAHALAALHEQGAVHRDVKGGNILVRREDGRAFLTDFGTCIYPGAATLTPPLWFPGTPAYRSPESWLFEKQFSRDTSARYLPSAADDLYSLAVTLCRLLTGEYPELARPTQDKAGLWHLEAVLPAAALLSGPQVDPVLREVALRLLSVLPEQRGTAAQVVELLERGMGHFVPVSLPLNLAGQAPPLPAPAPEEPSGAPAPERPGNSAPPAVREPPTAATSGGRRSAHLQQARVSAWRGRPWFALAAAVALGVWVWSDTPGEPAEDPALACAGASTEEEPDAGTRGLGELAAATSMEPTPAPVLQEKLADEPLPEPQPGQTRPNAKGQCPRKGQIALNRGCWAETSLDREGCAELNGQTFKGLCYVPIIPPGRRPTSGSTDKP